MKQIILIGAASRSGSTALDLMLGNAPSAFSCGEIYVVFEPFRTSQFNPRCNCSDLSCDYHRAIQTFSKKTLHREILKSFGFDVVVDSSKDLCWIADINLIYRDAADIEVINLLIYKNPKELAFSHWKRGRPLDYWERSYTHYYKRYLELGFDFYSINHDWLIADKETNMQRISKRIGLEQRPDRSDLSNGGFHGYYGSQGVFEQMHGIKRKKAVFKDYSEFLAAGGEDIPVSDTITDTLAQIRKKDIREHELSKSQTLKRRPLWVGIEKLKKIYKRYFPEDDSALYNKRWGELEKKESGERYEGK